MSRSTSPAVMASAVQIAAGMGACDDVELCTRACDAGTSEQCRLLGVTYEFGRSDAGKSESLGTAFFDRSCALGSPAGCVSSGQMHEYAHGVTKDVVFAACRVREGLQGGVAGGVRESGDHDRERPRRTQGPRESSSPLRARVPSGRRTRVREVDGPRPRRGPLARSSMALVGHGAARYLFSGAPPPVRFARSPEAAPAASPSAPRTINPFDNRAEKSPMAKWNAPKSSYVRRAFVAEEKRRERLTP